VVVDAEPMLVGAIAESRPSSEHVHEDVIPHEVVDPLQRGIDVDVDQNPEDR
jgi:hypothetical protein